MRNKVKILFFVFCFLFFDYIKSQNNLVLNPSFEQLISCPTGWFQADSAKYWGWLYNECDTSFSAQGECRGELYSSCCSNTFYCGVPYNSVGYQWPRTGNSYIELLLIESIPSSSSHNSRDYLKGQLSQTLQAGKQYCLTFYYNVSNSVEYAVNRLGAYVDNGSIGAYNCCKDIPINPQTQNNPAVFMTDTANWIKIQNSFTAIGNENTITLGNFVDSTIIQCQLFNSNGSIGEYYNIDDVSLIAMDLVPYAGHDTTIALNDSAYIGRPNEVGLNDDCIWYVLGNTTPLDTIAGMWVKPTTTTSYVVEQNICGVVSYDTVKVSLITTGIKQFTANNNSLKVYPNPSTGDVFISSSDLNNTAWKLVVTDITGRTVIENNYPANNSLIKLNTQLNNGVYFVKIILPNGSMKQQKVIITK